MFARIIVAVSLLFLATACSSTKSTTGGTLGTTTSSNETADVAERYRLASENLEPFTLISRDGNNVVRASDRVFFEYDSSSLSTAGQRTLDRQISWLKDHKNINMTIEGHCDERGTREYNLGLGERRSNAVKNYLASSGIDASRISTISYGKERPAVTGHTLDAYAENRRGVTVPDNL